MYSKKFRMVTLLMVLFAAFLAEPLHAADNLSEMVNISGRQRMLSQRIAKAYFYYGLGISQKETRIQMEQALTRFENSLEKLKKVEDSEVQETLSFIALAFADYKELVTKPYNKKDAALVLELSETLLSSCHEVVLLIEGLSGKHLDDIINISGRQRMLSQRVSKLYIAYQAGFQDNDTVQKLKTAVSEFETALDRLRKEERNTDQINMLLDKMKQRWEQISPYFLSVRKGGLPLMVLTNTDEVTNLAHQVTGLYVKIASAKK
ncbi:MAG: type IV pili methyl-accepting chemotaxis transducer N-terminal domain-containing protein [Candidatus Electrothrix sp. YB6]